MKENRYPREEELENAVVTKTLPKFMDTVSTLDELEVVKSLLTAEDAEYAGRYRKHIQEYSDYDISWIKNKYPLTFERLNLPGGNIVFARFSNTTDIIIDYVLWASEEVLGQLAKGQRVARIEVNHDSHPEHYIACELLSIFTQYSCQSLQRFLFPDVKCSSSGVSSFAWSLDPCT